MLGSLVKEQAFKRYILLEAGKIGKVSHIFDERGVVLYRQGCIVPERIVTDGVVSA